MTDLGHLLAGVEENVGHAHAGATPTQDALERARRTVRRRRLVRHGRDGAVTAVALVAVGAAVAWGLQPQAPAPADAPTAPTAPATATPAPEPTLPTQRLTLGAPVQVAAPLDVPVADLLAATGPGWSLAHVTANRLDAGDVWEPGDLRHRVELVSPTGERTALLGEVAPTTGVQVTAWRPGTTTAQATAFVDSDTIVSGQLDLLTGMLTPLPFEFEHHPLGLTVTGESAWLDVPLPDEVREAIAADPGRIRPVAPGARVAIDPESWQDPGVDPEHAPPAPQPPTGRLLLVEADGTARDAGSVTLPLRLHPLSPDLAWLAVLGPDGGLQAVDLRTGATHPVAGAPTDPACRLAGWADQHAVLTACPQADGTWRLDAVDLADDGTARRLATSDVPVRDAWPLGDGRVGLGLVVRPAPCDVTSDPAVLADGQVRSLTDGWSPYDHGTSLLFQGGAVWTHLNGCYPGSGRADPQRDVRVDLATGETTTLAWLDDRRDAAHVVVEDRDWLVTAVDLVPGR